MEQKLRLKLKVGRYYDVYDDKNGLLYCQYKGNEGLDHLFVFGEADKKGYVIVQDNMAEVREVIRHSPIAPCIISMFNRNEISAQKNPELVNLLIKLGEKI